MAPRKQSLKPTAVALNSGTIHLLRAVALVDRESGVPPAQLSALSVLVFGGPRTLGELARAEDVAGPTMTRVVDGLVGAGLAVRRPHPQDGRAVEVAPTRRGVEVMHRARDRRVEVLVAALRSLSSEDREKVAAAAPLLDDLADGVREALRLRAQP